MISIIICSAQPTISDSLSRNIKETIGEVEFEIIVVDNSKHLFGICHAYNIGIKQAKYPYLCFMHTDIVFHTTNWGNMAIEGLEHKDVGMLGVQGCCYFDESTSYWCRSGFRKAHIIQRKNNEYVRVHEEDVPCSNDVVALDGLWLFTRKSLFEHIRWDSKTFPYFHMYDHDICMQIIHAGQKLRILPDLWIEHQSWGNYDELFFSQVGAFHEKWDDKLPIATIPIDTSIEVLARKAALTEIRRLGKISAKSAKRLSLWTYKIATKLSLLLGKDIW